MKNKKHIISAGLIALLMGIEMLSMSVVMAAGTTLYGPAPYDSIDKTKYIITKTLYDEDKEILMGWYRDLASPASDVIDYEEPATPAPKADTAAAAGEPVKEEPAAPTPAASQTPETSAPANTANAQIEAQCKYDSKTKYDTEMSCDQMKKKDEAVAARKESDEANKEYAAATKEVATAAREEADKAKAEATAAHAEVKALNTEADCKKEGFVSCAQKQDLKCKEFSRDVYQKNMNCSELDAYEKNTAQKEADAANEKDIKEKSEAFCVSKGFESCEKFNESLKNTSGSGFRLNLDSLTLTTKDEKGNIQKSGKSIFKNTDYAQYGVFIGTILRVMDILIYLIGSLAFLTLIVAGIFMITNHGDEAWVTKGKTMMLYSILGMLVAFLSFVIVNVVETALA